MGVEGGSRSGEIRVGVVVFPTGRRLPRRGTGASVVVVISTTDFVEVLDPAVCEGVGLGGSS